ncbi:MAG: amidohydrolase family protein [Lentisphaeria bacterium]|nr:amidohydrolase family protein [Lentisphaeria bacterium]
MFDCHIHMFYGESDSPQEFMEKTSAAGITGGAVFSLFPENYIPVKHEQRWEHRLAKVLEFTSAATGFLPVLWIDPTDKDIDKQITSSVEQGIRGFKIICNHFYPEEILPQLNLIAETGRPVHFHSGILYSKSPAAKYNRPMMFECLMEVPRLRTALAHVGWPWTDEYTAIMGEFSCPATKVDIFADITPGTPMVYRQDVLKRLYLCGYEGFAGKVMWGSDASTNNYNTQAVAAQLCEDRKIMERISDKNNFFDVADYQPEAYSGAWQQLTEENFEKFYSPVK